MDYSSSDSEDDDDDVQRQRFLEAADPALFTNALYQTQQHQQPVQVPKKIDNVQPNVEELKSKEGIKVKSQRYLAEDDVDFGSASDIRLPESVRDHMYKKLTAMLNQQIEFHTIPADDIKVKQLKSTVKLLNDAKCFLKTDDELGDVWTQGPKVKPIIKGRKIIDEDAGVDELSEKLKLQDVAVSVADISAEIKHWATKCERSDKVFRYKTGAKRCVLYAIEPENEFTKLRQKNQWSEEKIKRKFRKV